MLILQEGRMSQDAEMHDYPVHIDLSATDSSQTQLFIFIKEYCNNEHIAKPRVLEIGCSGGYFSEVLRAHGMYVYGVEPFSDMAKRHSRVDAFFHGTVEDFCANAAEGLRKSFDLVVLGDVLEHLLHPKTVLLQLCEFLTDSGAIVASIPNITHIGIQHMLRDGQWIYQPFGLLDATHVRFFSRRGVRDMFTAAGFGIERQHDIRVSEESVYPPGVGMDVFGAPGKISRMVQRKIRKARRGKGFLYLLKKMGLLSFMDWQEPDTVFQFIVRATRKALHHSAYVTGHPQNILLVTHDIPAAEERLVKPLTLYAAEVQGAFRAVAARKCTRGDLLWADVLLVHRQITESVLEAVREANKLGLAVVYDCDEALNGAASSPLRQRSNKEKWFVEYTVSTADKVTCSCAELKEELQKHSPHVTIIPDIPPHLATTPCPIEKPLADAACPSVTTAWKNAFHGLPRPFAKCGAQAPHPAALPDTLIKKA